MRGPRRGEERSTTRTTAGGGVSSLKRGRNGYADSNSNGSGNGFRRWREREAEGGGEVGCSWCSRKEKGGREEGVAATGQHPFKQACTGSRGRGKERGGCSAMWRGMRRGLA
jgi:hypothetical protein